MRKHDYRIDTLRRVSFLANCSEEELARLAGRVDEVQVVPGHVLTEQGTAGRQTFIVVEGVADVLFDGKVAATIGPGEFAGEMSMLSHEPRSATVVARTAMTLLVIGPSAFTDIVSQPTVARAMATGLARRVRDADG